MGLAGFFVAVIVAGFRARRYELTRSDPVYIGAFAGLGLLAGGTLLFAITQVPYMWENRDYYLTTDIRTFASRFFGGMVFYGGLFGSIAGVYFYCRIMKAPFETAMKLFIPVIPLAHAIMRVGCFAGGCCHGIEHPPPLGITFTQAIGAPNNIPLLPVQLYEAITNLFIFVILWCYSKNEKSWMVTTCLYGLFYSFARFWLEFLRGDAIRGFVFGFSTSQFISIVVFSACILVICGCSIVTRKRSVVKSRDTL
jgi:phosphatidylglycerol:prolipoprotein diacylglycerol transferase